MEVKSILTGNYSIGNDGVPNAAPQHQRLIRIPFWILSSPFTWQMFEDEVLAKADRLAALSESAKQLCEAATIGQLRTLSLAMSTLQFWRNKPMSELPLTGMSWHECDSVAKALGGRLPTEIEWEIQVRVLVHNVKPSDSMQRCERVQIQEWTADAYAPKYWRADFAKNGTPWQEGFSEEVTIRGFDSTDLHRHPCFRRGSNPYETHPERGFRIAWDCDPIAFLNSSQK